MKVIFAVLLLYTSICKLVQVVSLFRHGARYHLNELYDGSSTKAMFGELTAVGMHQHQQLGQYLKEEYIDKLKFLSPVYNASEIDVYSTPINRTIQSVICQLYGIYPPGTGPRLDYVARQYHLPPYTNHTDIDQQNYALPEGGQPIQVSMSEKVILDGGTCPNYEKEVQKNIETQKQTYQEMNTTYYPFMRKMATIFGVPSDQIDFLGMTRLCDTIFVDRYLGRPLPPQFTDDDRKNLEHLLNWYNSFRLGFTLGRMVNTVKFRKILSEFDNRIISPDKYPRKWTFLSAHDTDLVPAQIGLNISSSQCIQELYRKGTTTALNCIPEVIFASSMIFQLHQNSGDYSVMVRYNGKYINMCEKNSTSCSYLEWKKRVKDSMINNVDQVCGRTVGESDKISPRQQIYGFEFGMKNRQTKISSE